MFLRLAAQSANVCGGARCLARFLERSSPAVVELNSGDDSPPE